MKIKIILLAASLSFIPAFAAMAETSPPTPPTVFINQGPPTTLKASSPNTITCNTETQICPIDFRIAISNANQACTFDIKNSQNIQLDLSKIESYTQDRTKCTQEDVDAIFQNIEKNSVGYGVGYTSKQAAGGIIYCNFTPVIDNTNNVTVGMTWPNIGKKELVCTFTND